MHFRVRVYIAVHTSLLCGPRLQFVHSRCKFRCIPSPPLPPPLILLSCVRTHPDKAMYPVLFDEVPFTLPAGLCCCVTRYVSKGPQVVVCRPDSIAVCRLLNDSAYGFI